MRPAKTKIHWVQVCSYATHDKIDTHSHEFFHYIYVIRGTGALQLEQNLYAMLPKRMYLVAPGKHHAFWNTGEERLVTCELKFDFFDVQAAEQAARLAECVDVGDAPVLGILQNIRREHAGRKPYSSDIIAMNLQEIFLHLQRVQQAGAGRQTPGAREDLVDVIEYIENNLDCDINLQDLANIVCLEKNYFLKKFKQLTGVTPMAYTRNARLRKAQELLRYSDMSITQIARATGFQSVHYFSRQFTAAVGMSPTRYKQMYLLP